jgi:hypothetical protein
MSPLITYLGVVAGAIIKLRILILVIGAVAAVWLPTRIDSKLKKVNLFYIAELSRLPTAVYSSCLSSCWSKCWDKSIPLASGRHPKKYGEARSLCKETEPFFCEGRGCETDGTLRIEKQEELL